MRCTPLSFFAIALLLTGGCTFSLLEGGDACDDDIDNDGDGLFDCADPGCALAPDCQPCGDGVVDDTEACDDGNLEDGDGCSAFCIQEHCGDGVVDPGETCDDGNAIPGDGCSFRCERDRCGDGTVQQNLGEQCDDGNLFSDDGCSARCTHEVAITCGNGNFDPGEDCEDGNKVSGDGCSSLCRAESCGDNVRQPRLGEECDGADTPDGETCLGCRLQHCGNGALEPQFFEECDDGNASFGDGCGSCRFERCGDGVTLGPEQCDDGGILSNDGCSSTCRLELCGDGIVQSRLGELCDDSSADCEQCQVVRACDGAVCFQAGVSRPQILPGVLTLVRGPTPRAVLLQGGSLPMVYDVTEGRLVNERQMPNFFFAGSDVRAAQLDGDAQDEVVVATPDGSVMTVDLADGSFEVQFSFGVRVLDLELGDAAGDVGLDIVAVSGSSVGLIIDGLQTLVVPLIGGVASRATTAAVDGSRGLVLSRGASELVGYVVDRGELVEQASWELGTLILDVDHADIDDDGVMDVVALTAAPDELVGIALGGALSAPPVVLASSPGANGMAVADVDGDGLDDVVTTSPVGALFLHRQAVGFARGARIPAPSAATRPDARDIDGDGDVDLLVGGVGFQAIVYAQQ